MIKSQTIPSRQEEYQNNKKKEKNMNKTNFLAKKAYKDLDI